MDFNSTETNIALFINGQSHVLKKSSTLTHLIEFLGVKAYYLAIAINEEVIPKACYSSTFLKEGDRVEIINPVAGG